MSDDDLKVPPVEPINRADMQIAGFTDFQYDFSSAMFGARAPRVVEEATVPDALLDPIPPVPTDDARAAVARAAEVVEELRARNRELHFSMDPDTKIVVIEVRDLDGNVLRTIPPSKVLDVMAGGEL